MAVLCMKGTEPRQYHVWPGRENDEWNMRGLVDSCIQWYMYHNLSKISPPLFLNEVVAKGPFLLKVLPPIYAVVHAFRASKKHRRSSSV